MRRSIVVSAVAAIVIGLGATPALAAPERPIPVPPASPRGLDQSDVVRPDSAITPVTGPINGLTNGNSPKE